MIIMEKGRKYYSRPTNDFQFGGGQRSFYLITGITIMTYLFHMHELFLNEELPQN